MEAILVFYVTIMTNYFLAYETLRLINRVDMCG